jgi:hypothetical protein
MRFVDGYRAIRATASSRRTPLLCAGSASQCDRTSIPAICCTAPLTGAAVLDPAHRDTTVARALRLPHAPIPVRSAFGSPAIQTGSSTR